MVAGGGGGIGRAIAWAYPREGADVAVASRPVAEVEEVSAVVNSLGHQGLALAAGLDSAEAAARVARAAIRELGKIDCSTMSAAAG